MKVLLSGGGTLGSVTPLLAVAAELRRLEPEVELRWAGTRSGPERELVEAEGIEFVVLPSGRLRRFLSWRNLLLPVRLLAGLVKSLRLLRTWRPDVVVHAGGYVAVPLAWAARLRDVPVHLHQLDWRPGLANRLSAPFVVSVSGTFEKSRRDFGDRSVKVTGTPIRPAVRQAGSASAYDKWGLSPDRPLVLVLGGGTGALGLNRLVAKALPRLPAELQLVHLTGPGKPVEVPEWGGKYVSLEFVGPELPSLFRAADLVVTRAGMGTLFELSAVGCPAVIVPMPGSHQEDNVGPFVRVGGAVRFDQRSAPEKLAELITSLIDDHKHLEQMSRGIRQLDRPLAAAEVAEMIRRTARLGQ